VIVENISDQVVDEVRLGVINEGWARLRNNQQMFSNLNPSEQRSFTLPYTVDEAVDIEIDNHIPLEIVVYSRIGNMSYREHDFVDKDSKFMEITAERENYLRMARIGDSAGKFLPQIITAIVIGFAFFVSLGGSLIEILKKFADSLRG